jgi:predicted NBD/HSP70 family sugar kinase
MRAINAARVIRELRASGPMTRASIVRATGLSKPTITNVVAHLETDGFLEAVDTPPAPGSGAAQRAQEYSYRANRGHVLGIDLGSDSILVVLADLAGTTLGTGRIDTQNIRPFDPEQILQELQTTTRKVLAGAGIEEQSLLEVVVGTPGVVSPEGVVRMAPQLPGWEDLNLGARLERLFDCPVRVEREVALSLLAERAVGVATTIDNALFIQLGVGVAAGLLVDGEIYRGAWGGAGEIGMMPLPPGAPAFVPDGRDSGLGPFELQTGGAAFRRRGRELAATPAGAGVLELAGGDIDQVDALILFTAMRQGDAAAAALVHEIIDYLAWGISCLVCALNPQTIILGGGISQAADLFLPQLQGAVAAVVPFAPHWLVSTLGEDAVSAGAVFHATELVEKNMFSPPRLRRSVR